MLDWVHAVQIAVHREVTVRGAFWLSADQKRQLERRLRGQEEFQKLQQASGVVVSFGKSGRTWLRVMISRCYQTQFGLTGYQMMGFDNLHRRHAAIPKLLFTHDNYLGDYTGQRDNKRDYLGKRVVLLIRDPRDTAVSQFFQWKHRMRATKKRLNDYPEATATLGIFEFMQSTSGLPKVIEFLNQWAVAQDTLSPEQLLVVRYEDLHQRPVDELTRVMTFFGTPVSPEAIHDAVEFARFDNLKKLEKQRAFGWSGGRLVAKNPNNPDSYKVRRAKVGGYRDYFDDEQIQQLDAFTHRHLHPRFRYD